MAQKVVGMEAKLRAVLMGGCGGVSVAALCSELAISRQTFYKYRRRFAVEGPAGLVERSRRPHSSPAMVSAEIEEMVVRLRKELVVDNGAAAIAWHLQRRADELGPVPSARTV